MTINALDMIRWSTVLNLAFTYWCLSNNQIFNNILFVMLRIDEITHSGHSVLSDLTNLYYDPEIPPFILTLIFLVMIPMGTALSKMLKFGVEIEVDENLGNYF